MAAGRDWLRALQLYGGLAVGLVAMGGFVVTLDWPGLGEAVRRARPAWLLAAAVVMLGYYAVHAWRFRVLLRGVAPKVSSRTVWRATTVLWAMNTILPLRAGLFLRPMVVLREVDAPYAAVLATFVAETVCDLFGIVVLLLVLVGLLPPELAEQGPLRRVKSLGGWAGATSLVLLAGVFLMSSPGSREFANWLVRPIPSERAREAALAGFDQLIAGLASVRDPWRFAEAMALTLLTWLAWFVGIDATLRAFSIEVGAVGALFVETALTLAMMVPQAPGFLGLFQVVVEESLGVFGAPRSGSEAVALLFWALCFVPITALGFWDAWRLGLSASPDPATSDGIPTP